MNTGPYNFIFLICLSLLVLSCADQSLEPLHQLLSEEAALTGKSEYLNSPYVTAGDRVYMVGHQNGDFPDLGWHITGEMGGIWDHPIKLMDGFSIGINNGETYWCLNQATSFTNYPFANLHIFQLDEKLKVSRLQFVPDGLEGLILELKIENSSYEATEISVDFTGFVDLRPTWLSEQLNIKDDLDEIVWNDDDKAFVAKDQSNRWFTAFGSDRISQIFIGIDTQCDLKESRNGAKATLSETIKLEKGEFKILRYYISGSSRSEAEAIRTYQVLKEQAVPLLSEKIARFKELKSSADIQIPEEEIAEMYTWVKYNTDWLIRDVEGVGRGLSAGIPDYPWWFGADNCYALQGLLATGRFEEVKTTARFLIQLSSSGNDPGRVMHEASTNGVVYNRGNLNETPHFIYLIWKIYEWTGDRAFLEETYPFVKHGMNWILGEDKDKNGYPDGPGMMEIPGLHTEMIDVAVYTQQALEAAGNIAKELGELSIASTYQANANELKDKINTDWWVEDSESYADFRSTKLEALELMDQAIVRADTLKKPWTVEELTELRAAVYKTPQTGTNGYVVHHNWVVNTPMEMGIAPQAQGLRALNTGTRYTSPFGMYVTGIDRDENQQQSSKWKSFSYVGAVMTLPTGIQAIAEARYGRPDESFSYLKMLRESFSYALPGSMYEVSPDYGMIVQAWNTYAISVPIVEYYFGIKPQAPNKRVLIDPSFPKGWENVAISQVRVGENEVSYSRKRENERVIYTFSQKEERWTILFRLNVEQQVLVNGEPANFQGDILTLTGGENVVEIIYN